MYQYLSASEAVKCVQSGNRVYVQGASAVPTVLTKALTDRAPELRNVEICHLHTEGVAYYADPSLKDSFHVNSFFIGKNVRHTLTAGNGSYTPIFLSEIPLLFRKNILPLDVVLIHITPPDVNGFCSLGTSVEATVAAIECAKFVVAQVNPHMPRTFGDSILHISKIHYLVEVNEPLQEGHLSSATPEEEQIGKHIASLVEDRSTLQLGIGAIPNAVLTQLTTHRDLGLHTEMFSDGVIDLIKRGVITCKYKGFLKGRCLATFISGTQRLYDFVHDNPFIELRESSVVNDTANIRKNKKMVSINSAIEIDVTGQVCANSIGANMYSGVGGQMDFVRGATLSEGGKAIIAMTSVTKKGVSKIVPFLKRGADVVTTRSHVRYVVTEYGIADLYGKTLKQRVLAMANIAHPDHREQLQKIYWDSIS